MFYSTLNLCDNLTMNTYNKYCFIRELGSGKFSDVWLAKRDSKFFAIKILNIKKNKDYAYGEVKFLKKFTKSEYLINMVDHFKIHLGDESKDVYFCIVLEYMGKDLYWLINNYNDTKYNIPKNLIKNITIRLTKGIIEYHSYDIIHTDLKPENILISPLIHKHPCFSLSEKKYNKLVYFTIFNSVKVFSNYNRTLYYPLFRELLLTVNNNIKITDFGTALCDHEKHKTFNIVTRHYRPPEVILMHPYNKSVDMWSLGCIIYELITLNVLFNPDKNNNISRNSHHIALFIKTFGNIPNHIIKNSKKKYRYFDLNNSSYIYLFQYLIGKKISLSKIFTDYWNIQKKEVVFYTKLIKPLFDYDPKKRITAENYLNYINNI